MFFVSWLLWEQMTFVLAVAILVVCFIGYIKLLWTNRIVRKQEIVDEEKRTKIEALRKSGQIVESQKSHEIPFGVRAIQSGIQVQGIWISQANTPAASQLGFSSGGASPEMLPSPDSKNGTVTDIRPLTNQVTQPHYLSDQDILQRYDETHRIREAADGSRVQSAYKPKTASHLRDGSYGGLDQTTLHHLEGTSAHKKVHVHQPRHSSSRYAEVEGESSAAGDELSSGVSSRSDTSLSRNMQDEAPLKSRTMISEIEIQSPAGVQSSRAEYFSVHVESPYVDMANPFQTPATSPMLSSIPLIAFDNSEEYSRFEAQAQEPFKAGELHLNKSVRKVNSGFEVLPAGTFGVKEAKGKGLESDTGDDSGERRQSKLQKRARTSMTGRRTSTGIER